MTTKKTTTKKVTPPAVKRPTVKSLQEEIVELNDSITKSQIVIDALNQQIQELRVCVFQADDRNFQLEDIVAELENRSVLKIITERVFSKFKG